MDKKLMRIYADLLKAYGPQGWWPTTRRGFTPKYLGGPKSEKERLEVIFGAILTQNTQWDPNVVTAIVNLNKEGLIDTDRILKIPDSRLAELIKSSGYNNQKAERLKIMSSFIKESGGLKRLFSLPIGELRETLLSIKGVGPETADSIILYSARKPIFVVDAYIKRIFSRLGFLDENAKYDDVQRFFMENLPHDEMLFNEYHALIVEHAKRCCRKAPLSGDCVLKRYCRLDCKFF